MKFYSLLVGALLLAMPMFAGEGYKKCTATSEQCLSKMAQKFENKGWLGVELDRNDKGALTITKVVENSPAAKAGFKVGETFVALNDIRYDAGEEAMKKIYKQFTIGNTVTYTLSKKGHERQVKVTLGTLPDDKAKWVGKHMVKAHMQAAIN